MFVSACAIEPAYDTGIATEKCEVEQGLQERESSIVHSVAAIFVEASAFITTVTERAQILV